MKKIALLSHRGDNIGHDFMAIGVEEILRRYFNEIEITHFEQHDHFSIYENSRVLRKIDKIPHGKFKWIRRILNLDFVKKFLLSECKDLGRFDVAIMCGGPNICRSVSNSPEMQLMLDHVPGAFANSGVKVIDIGAGSAFPLEKIPEKIESENDIKLFKKLFNHVIYSTVREPYAYKMWNKLGHEKLEKIPCAAFASGYFFEKFNISPEFVVINYQEAGANDDWGQGVDRQKWRADLIVIIQELIKKNYKILFLCHSDREYYLARKLVKELNIEVEIHNPKSIYDYTKVIEKAKFGIVSRIHAAIPMAGCGIPSVVIGADTRLFAPKELGLKTYFVKEVVASKIIQDIEYYDENYGQVSNDLLSLRNKVSSQYHEVFDKCNLKNLRKEKSTCE